MIKLVRPPERAEQLCVSVTVRVRCPPRSCYRYVLGEDRLGLQCWTEIDDDDDDAVAATKNVLI